jgi:hypothetical protein
MAALPEGEVMNGSFDDRPEVVELFANVKAGPFPLSRA